MKLASSFLLLWGFVGTKTATGSLSFVMTGKSVVFSSDEDHSKNTQVEIDWSSSVLPPLLAHFNGLTVSLILGFYGACFTFLPFLFVLVALSILNSVGLQPHDKCISFGGDAYKLGYYNEATRRGLLCCLHRHHTRFQ
jgi:hypothetical protein